MIQRSDDPKDWGDGEVRYFIVSFGSDAERFGSAVRQHWGIENSLHCVMDVTFGGDESRIRKDHGAENVSWLRRLAVTLVKYNQTSKASIRQKRLRAGYNFEFLLEILNSVPGRKINALTLSTAPTTKRPKRSTMGRETQRLLGLRGKQQIAKPGWTNAVL